MEQNLNFWEMENITQMELESIISTSGWGEVSNCGDTHCISG